MSVMVDRWVTIFCVTAAFITVGTVIFGTHQLRKECSASLIDIPRSHWPRGDLN
jgi:hypothetical protein